MSLNPKQQKAADHTEGPLLILAGAGSGKTTVLMNRISNMIQKGIDPNQILAVTFTNKAANEMKERIEKIIGERARYLWMSTFHSMCVRILRYEVDFVSNLDKNFSIYDSSNSKSLIKRIMTDLGLAQKRGEEEDSKAKPETIQGYISALKNEMIDVKSFLEQQPSNDDIDWEKAKDLISSMKDHYEIIAKVYPKYQEELIKCNAADFDDLILYTIDLFKKHPTVLERYQERFKYIMVDEYQDTNHAQYVLMRILASKYKNIAVVGDDYQSIYAFRGADIRNILNFDKEYPNATVIKLEQNYRSTKNIIHIANEIISKNKNQKHKTLFTDNVEGEKVKIYESNFSDEEAYFLAYEIKRLQNKGYSLNDIAVLYRNNAQSGSVETILNRYGIPNVVTGGIGFWGRMEILDIVAYLQFICNPNSMMDFERIVNKPKRGIGKASVDKLLNQFEGESFLEHLKIFKLPKKTREGMNNFLEIIEEFIEKKDSLLPSVLIMDLIKRTNYKETYAKEDREKRRDRDDHLDQLIQIAMDFENRHNMDVTLDDFMEEVVLRNVQEEYDDDTEKVSLMTIHASKGLEFPVVFIIGMNDGKFPAIYSMDPEGIEEERRCCYVAVTRAKKVLYLVYSKKERDPYKKDRYGRPEEKPLKQSTFLKDFDTSVLEPVDYNRFY